MSTQDLKPRPTDVGREEMNTTRFERFLAAVLAIFMLIGLLWLYAQPLDRTDDGRSYDTYTYIQEPYGSSAPASGPAAADPGEPRPGDRDAVRALNDAAVALNLAQDELATATEEMESAREAYRTRLDANEPAETYKKEFEDAEKAVAAAEKKVADAQAAYDKVEPAGRDAQARLAAAAAELQERLERETFIGRLALTLVAMLGSVLALHQLHRRRPRYTLLGMSAVGAATALAITMTGDYIDIEEAGPVVLSVAGIAVTLAVFVAYQRWLARRLPERRVRKGECPFCGYPAREAGPANSHCQGCGRCTVGSCTTCHQPRRVGARFCGACGAG